MVVVVVVVVVAEAVVVEVSCRRRTLGQEFFHRLYTSRLTHHWFSTPSHPSRLHPGLVCLCLTCFVRKCLFIFVCFVRLYTTDLYNYGYLRIVFL